MTEQELKSRFTYHAPRDKDQIEKYQVIRMEIFALACTLNTLLPESREKSLAFTALEEACFWANASIARHD